VLAVASALEPSTTALGQLQLDLEVSQGVDWILQTLVLVGDHSASLIGAASERALARPYPHAHNTNSYPCHATTIGESSGLLAACTFPWALCVPITSLSFDNPPAS
jgi:hypothetical protein